MNARDLLIELFGRIPEHVREAVSGLDAEQLATAPEPGSNSVGWMVWHLARGQDEQVSELREDEQVWVTGDWPARFGLTPDPADTGFGHTAAQVAEVRPDSPEALIGYYDAVAARTNEFLNRLTETDLDLVVDERWDPPVTMGVRLISIADDDIQHAGQAKYVRGLLDRRTGQ